MHGDSGGEEDELGGLLIEGQCFCLVREITCEQKARGTRTCMNLVKDGAAVMVKIPSTRL